MRSCIILLFTVLIAFSGCRKDDPQVDDPIVDLQNIAYNPSAHTIPIPPLFPQMVIPADNPTTQEGVLLGRFLFYDPIMSRDSSISCATCHKQELSFTDGLDKSIGIDGKVGKRSSMSLANIGFANRGLFWDGRVSSLEIQALHPVEDPNEMDEKWPNVIRKLQVHPTYQQMFRKAFGIKNNKEITKEMVAKALAQFQRTMVSAGSKYDKFIRQEILDLDNDEFEGMSMFNDNSGGALKDGGCAHCHSPVLFTADNYFNNGLLTDAQQAMTQTRFNVTGFNSDMGKFRAVSLRNIALTAPYMHDGSLASLDDVIEHYSTGGVPSTNVDGLIPEHGAVPTSASEKDKLIKFLNTLTDTEFINNPAFKNPFEQ
ncbi:MAG: cytochrome C peroxidase [Saprospiraceae bacterium]|nr:cytochrome C peroxidase [Saprospiraceae bacterium]